MSLEEATAAPARMSLVDLHTGESMEMQFNPEELPEEVSVNWTRLTVPGMSHQQIQFVNTNNHTFSLELYYRATSEEEALRNKQAKHFLLSLCYPSESAGDVATGGPPRVLFVWPSSVSMVVVVTKVRIQNKRFSQKGLVLSFSASLEVEEVRDGRLTSEQVRAYGTQRGVGG